MSEMEKLRQMVVSEIKSNQQLETDLNQMDIKIGLLVKNRITLQVNVFSTTLASSSAWLDLLSFLQLSCVEIIFVSLVWLIQHRL